MKNTEQEEGVQKKFRRRMDRLLLGVIVGGAVGSILGVTLAPKSGKETRKQMCDRSKETWQWVSEIIDEKSAQKAKGKKKGFWHLLNRILVRKKRNNDSD